MSEVLLQAIVEKLDALSVIISKFADLSRLLSIHEALAKELALFPSEIKKLGERLTIVNNNLNKLISIAENQTFQSNQALTTNVEHRHYLHKGIWISVVL